MPHNYILNSILAAISLMVFSTNVHAERMCKKMQPTKYDFIDKAVDNGDWSWSCSNGILSIEVYNKISATAHKLKIVGSTKGTTAGESVSIQGNTNGSTIILAKNFCRKEKGARLYLTYMTREKEKCLEYYTEAEALNVKKEQAREAKKRKTTRTIYNNCVVSKSRNVDRSALGNVKRLCVEISKNPSIWQRLRWGS